MSKKHLQIIPLGGLGEVGKNMMAYEYDDDILIVDTGIMFPDNDMLGIDYIIPDFDYVIKKRNHVRGIILTHGHEDHVGAIHHVLDQISAPVYGTPLTRGLAEVKLARNGMSQKADLRTVNAGETAHIGPFTVDFFHVCHSIPDSVGLGIDTPAGLIVHCSDYKFDHTPVDSKPSDYAKLSEFSKRGVLALLSDSTNAERPGWTPSERVIDTALASVFSEAKGRIIVVTFASLISRMQQVVNAADHYKRKVAFAGTSMVDNVKISKKMGYLDIPDNLSVSVDQAAGMKDRDVVIMCTGSQGEPSSILGRLSMGTNRQFDLKPGDTIILSSHPIPGNEEVVYRTINRLFQRGANVIYEAIAPVHVSGHASQEEMKLLIHLTRPKYVIPVHGELRMLKQHAHLAEQVGIPTENIAVVENGQIIEFDGGEMHLGERIPGGYVFVDGSGVGDVSSSIVREREALGQDGIVLVNLTLNKSTGKLSTTPEIISRGFILPSDGESIMSSLNKRIKEVISRADGNLQAEMESTVKTFLFNETRRRPTVFVMVSRV